jgi:hypothetical protein
VHIIAGICAYYCWNVHIIAGICQIVAGTCILLLECVKYLLEYVYSCCNLSNSCWNVHIIAVICQIIAGTCILLLEYIIMLLG